MSDSAAARSRSNDSGARLNLREALQFASLAGAACYGAGWVFFVALYNTFKLQPELAGIDTEYIVVRSVVVASAAALVASIMFSWISPAGWLRRGRQGHLRPFYVVLSCASLCVFLLTAGPAALIIRYQWDVGVVWCLTLGLFVGAVAGIATVVFTALSVGFTRASPRGAALGVVNPRWSLATIALLFLVVLVLAGGAGMAVGDAIRRGNPVSTLFLTVPRVDLALSTNAVIPPQVGHTRTTPTGHLLLCGMRLGRTSSNVVLFNSEAHVVITIPSNSVVEIHRGGRC